MPVPVLLIAVVAVIVVLLLLFLIYKILQKRRKAATDLSEKNASKDEYEKLEEGQEVFDQEQTEDESVAKEGKTRKKKKRKGKKKSAETEGIIDSKDITGSPVQFSKSRLQLSVFYAATRRQLLVTIHQAENIGLRETTISEVRITLLPLKTQRLKTKCQLSVNPVFNQFFTFHEVYPEDFQEAVLRIRCYILNGRKRILVGEIRVDLATELSLDENNFENQWKEFTPAQDLIADDISDTAHVTDPESILDLPKEKVPLLLISLQHKSVTGKLTVKIIKARHIKVLPNQRSPETFVEMVLLNGHGGEVASARTSVCKGSFHPAFEETFYFPAIEFELDGLTLVFSLFNKKFRKKELVGTFRIGRESTGEREQLHWELMMEAQGEEIQGWYILINNV